MSSRSRRPDRSAASAPRGTGQVRVIGGRWRNTRLQVPERPGLRPTSDRVRETLFNWLMPKLPGARVLDLFAGSGALGLEALSRGAVSATLVERDPGLSSAIGTTLSRLEGGQAGKVLNTDALAWLDGPVGQRYDIAFVDPPFADGLWERVLERLPAHLADGAWLYVEAPVGQDCDPGTGWHLHREGSTREVCFALYRRQGAVTLGSDIQTTESA